VQKNREKRRKPQGTRDGHLEALEEGTSVRPSGRGREKAQSEEGGLDYNDLQRKVAARKRDSNRRRLKKTVLSQIGTLRGERLHGGSMLESQRNQKRKGTPGDRT